MNYFRKPSLLGNTKNVLSSVIARDKYGWAVMISIYFKPEEIGIDDCGLIGYIEHV